MATEVLLARASIRQQKYCSRVPGRARSGRGAAAFISTSFFAASSGMAAGPAPLCAEGAGRQARSAGGAASSTGEGSEREGAHHVLSQPAASLLNIRNWRANGRICHHGTCMLVHQDGSLLVLSSPRMKSALGVKV